MKKNKQSLRDLGDIIKHIQPTPNESPRRQKGTKRTEAKSFQTLINRRVGGEEKEKRNYTFQSL